MKIRNKTINKYLKMVEHTEPPELYHVWSLVYMASCALGRRCYFQFGEGRIFPNMYVLLVGNPGARKSTAIGIAKKLTTGNKRIRFSPDDTGGQRQGLISAMVDDGLDLSVDDVDGLDKMFSDIDYQIRNGRNNDAVEADALKALDAIDTTTPYLADRHTLYICASEFSSFIGIKSFELITFLTKMWDGEEYDYRLKNSQCSIKEPLLGLIGGTTPVAIANSMPVESVGQGFMSRVILVYAERKKAVARPKSFDTVLQDEIRQVITDITIGEQFSGGAFGEAVEASKLIDSLYDCDLPIDDYRFEFYKTRRHTHLIKTAMAIAALRGSFEISLEDVLDAEDLLKETETAMPDALGEFGLSAVSVVRQKIIDIIRTSGSGATPVRIRNQVARDVRPVDFQQIMHDLTTSGQIVLVADETTGQQVYLHKSSLKAKSATAEELLLLS